MDVAIVGRTQILYETALSLHRCGHHVAVVITDRAAPEYERTEHDFRQLAATLGAAFLLTGNLDDPDVMKLCRGLDIGISVNWKTLVHDRHLKLFRLGILNAHLGDLPRYRGNATPNWAIVRQEDSITATLHFMEDSELDSGRVIPRNQLALGESTTIADVYGWSAQAIPTLFTEALDHLEVDEGYTLERVDSDSPDAFRCYPRLPEDGFIEWQASVDHVHALIRAVCPPFAGAYTYFAYQGQVRKLIILQSRIVQHRTRDIAVPGHVLRNDSDSGESWVRCGDGVLALRKCRLEGETDEFSPGRRWKSIRMRLGIRVEDWMWQEMVCNSIST